MPAAGGHFAAAFPRRAPVTRRLPARLHSRNPRSRRNQNLSRPHKLRKSSTSTRGSKATKPSSIGQKQDPIVYSRSFVTTSGESSRMQFEYDPEFLIQVVSKRPGLWDYDHPDYREKKVRMKLWNEVVQELMQTEVSMTKGEMRELELQLQKKWKSLRDCFQKYLSNPNKTKRPYLYSKQLQFLLKDQKLPKRSSVVIKDDGSVGSAEEEDEQKPMWKPRKRLKLSKNDDASDDENDPFEAQDDSNEYTPVKPDTPVAKSSSHEGGHFAFANVDAVLKNDGDDPDKMFLLSLLPHLKSIPDEFRLNAKMELMQVLQQANYSISKLI